LSDFKRQDLKDFHQKFYGAGNIEFAAVGAFDADTARAALTKGIEGWKKAPAYTRVPDPYHAVNAKTFNINTPDKANAFFLTTLPINVQDTDPRFPALYLANYLLGGSETSRLWSRVRVKDGLSYDVRSVLDASAYEPSGDWSIYAIQAPQNSQRLQKAVHEELARALKDGFSAKEVQEGIHALLNYRKLARAQDGVLARTWIGYLQQNRTFEWSEQMDKKLAGLTADDVNAALRDVLKPADFSTAVAGDEAKMK
jgi:zinc protease